MPLQVFSPKVLDETNFRHVTVAGDTIMSVQSAISADALCKILLEKYGFEDVNPLVA